MSKFKVGDKVRIAPGHRWLEKYSSVGKITRTNEGGKFTYHRAKFPDENEYPFLEEELVFADESSSPEKEITKRLYREIHALEAEIFEMFMETQ